MLNRETGGSRRAALVLPLLVLCMPARATADVAEYELRRYDGRGTIGHAVPVDNKHVRMVAERVVLVPDGKEKQSRLLAHVWYDLVNEGPDAKLRIGFPGPSSTNH